MSDTQNINDIYIIYRDIFVHDFNQLKFNLKNNIDWYVSKSVILHNQIIGKTYTSLHPNANAKKYHLKNN